MKYPQHLLKLIASLKRLPGIGNKSAERFAFHMLDWHQQHLEEMADIIRLLPTKIFQCPECGCLMEEGCRFCTFQRQQSRVMCVIAQPKDVFAIENTHEYQGLYHVLGGLLSPLDGITADKLAISKLKERIINFKVNEVVIALDSTVEGDATALYLKQELASFPILMTRLAFGLPMGSSLEYVDGGTLARAFVGRSHFGK